MPSKLVNGKYKNITAKIDLEPLNKAEFNNDVNEHFGRAFFDYEIFVTKRSAKFNLADMSIGENNQTAYFQSITLLNQDLGEIITKEWQGKNLMGLRYYMPFTVIWTAEKDEEENSEEVKRNVAITSIHPTNFTLGFKKQVLVGVKNLGDQTITTNIDFTSSSNSNTQQQSVTLAPGDGTELIFPFTPTEKKFTIMS